MTVILDTSILIDHLRGDPRARRALEDVLRPGGERVVASVLTRIEVRAGMKPSEQAPTDLLLSLLEWIAVDEALADRAGDLARQHLRSHPGVDSVDFVIAATVERFRGTLWTRNRKHFPMLGELGDPYRFEGG